jgi:hypothetical protein
MFVVTEAEAAAIRAAFEQSGEPSGNDAGTLPRLPVVRDAGKQPAQLDRSR